MNKSIYIVLILMGFSLHALGQRVTQFTGTGNWNTAANWSSGVPDSTVSVDIISTNVEIDSIASCFDLFLSSGGVTVQNGGSLSVFGRYVNYGGGLRLSTGSLILKGSVSNIFGNDHVTIGSSIQLSSELEVSNTYYIINED